MRRLRRFRLAASAIPTESPAKAIRTTRPTRIVWALRLFLVARGMAMARVAKKDFAARLPARVLEMERRLLRPGVAARRVRLLPADLGRSTLLVNQRRRRRTTAARQTLRFNS